MSQTQSGGRYTQISTDEFESFLSDIAQWERVNGDGVTKENVYALPLPSDRVEIRVFSTLQDGKARDCGNDAIRTVVWDKKHDTPIGGESKTLRIETWRSNLEPKIRDLYANWRRHDHGECPSCGEGVMVERESEDGWEFLGCSNYPSCQNMEDLDR